MKTILCYGDSNTWGADPATGSRFDHRTRWPGVLRELLNSDAEPDNPAYWVVEEGLNGRTTCREDPMEGDKNGLRQLLPILQSHAPLDLVIIMLGTNDLKIRFNPTAYDIARGAQLVAKAALRPEAFKPGAEPQVIMVCPPPTAKLSYFKPMFGDCGEISRELSPRYRQFAREIGAHFLDAGEHIRSSDLDGIHLEASEHRKLAEALAQKIREILPR
ncbi:SGNH/GDSL hydrolase family protein [Gracilinema caldarium]|uniref:SGNH/GDSL hydrolase family protein n=1 Tax=Gracilinema caldarium TaxID=215591 RepID=UPI0026EBA06B|nr:SGNH/GDSL hydrolase family protein [Gracilinema caldarium]